MTVEWVVTSHTASGEPAVWALKGAVPRASLYRYVRAPGWFLTCTDLHIDRQDLKSKTLEEAQKEAVTLLQEIFRTVGERYLEAADRLQEGL